MYALALSVFCLAHAPAPAPVPIPLTDSLLELRVDNAMCTATIVSPRRADGRWRILTAAHCWGKRVKAGTVRVWKGEWVKVTLVVIDHDGDLAWCVTDASVEGWTGVTLALVTPPADTAVWQAGHGLNQPRVRKDGVIASAKVGNGMVALTLSVSGGDSGGAIFDAKTGELIAVVSGTTGPGKRALMFGGGSARAIKLMPADDSPVQPRCMPTYQRSSRGVWEVMPEK